MHTNWPPLTRKIPPGQGLLWSVGEDKMDDGGHRQAGPSYRPPAFGEHLIFLVPTAALKQNEGEWGVYPRRNDTAGINPAARQDRPRGSSHHALRSAVKSIPRTPHRLGGCCLCRRGVAVCLGRWSWRWGGWDSQPRPAKTLTRGDNGPVLDLRPDLRRHAAGWGTRSRYAAVPRRLAGAALGPLVGEVPGGSAACVRATEYLVMIRGDGDASVRQLD